MKSCANCKYSEPIGGGLACMGQKGMPFVVESGCCENWKTTKQTNADRIRAMTDEELAEFIAGQRGWYCDFKDPTDDQYPQVLDWLKQEVTE